MVNFLESRKRTKNVKSLRLVSIVIFLLAATGIVLYRCPSSLQDIGRMMQSAVGRVAGVSAGKVPAETVLRGTVYDRNLKELAVSYRLFSLYVHPAEVKKKNKAAEKLSTLLNEKKEIIAAQLKSTRRVVELADDLDEKQALAAHEFGLAGVYCKPVEVRFYPGHTAASHVLGFVNDGVGLAGVESRYDTVLQPGEFRENTLGEIDFQGMEVLGRTSTDLILTLDIALQKRLGAIFRKYLTAHAGGKGMGLLIEPGSGRIAAFVNYPTFNPNYFWQADEAFKGDSVYQRLLDKDLIRPLLVRAAAIQSMGPVRAGLLPQTVARLDYGLESKVVEEFLRQVGLEKQVDCRWGSGQEQGKSINTDSIEGPALVSGVQMGVALASLVNGGWRIMPYALESIYDHGTARRFARSDTVLNKSHVIEPAIGVKLRRDLPAKHLVKGKATFAFAAETMRIVSEEDFSRYAVQQVFVGMVPVKRPKYLLLMAVEKGYLNPLPKRSRQGKEDLEALGRKFLASLEKEGQKQAEAMPGIPAEKNTENLRQFFISKRLDFQEDIKPFVAASAAMPQVTGLSLRKGLQRLNQHKVKIRVNGSGKITGQYPVPGTSLNGVNECILTLQSKNYGNGSW